ncbi:MAG: hypothetical protein V7644_787 [Actinomycetota bacterium]
MLPSLWEAVSGRLEVEWALRRDDGSYLSFTPEMDKVWRWKDELPTQGLACVGKHLGRWSTLVAPRLLAPLYSLTGRTGAADDFRSSELEALDLELAEAVLAAGPATGPELRALVGTEKRPAEAAILRLQRRLVLTSSGLVEQRQGWGAIAYELVARRWSAHLRDLPPPDDARRTLGMTVLASAGDLSAADLGGALGWRLKASRELLDELAERGQAERTEAPGIALWRSTSRREG